MNNPKVSEEGIAMSEKRCPICQEMRDRCMDNEYCHYRWPKPNPQKVAHKKENTMKYEVAMDENIANTWRVEAIDFEGDGDCYVTIFGGPDSEARAREYAAYKSEPADTPEEK